MTHEPGHTHCSTHCSTRVTRSQAEGHATRLRVQHDGYDVCLTWNRRGPWWLLECTLVGDTSPVYMQGFATLQAVSENAGLREAFGSLETLQALVFGLDYSVLEDMRNFWRGNK